MQRFWTCWLLFVASATALLAQSELPSAEPTMTVRAADGTESDETAYDGSAPMTATFKANPTNMGEYEPAYEWRFTKVGEQEPFIVRFEENMEYTFAQSGTFSIELRIAFINGSDTITYETDEPFTVNISESKLEVPNAFSPNGDGINDTFHVKEGYQSLVSFEATVFNRWGKKIFSWKNPAEGWDGKDGGKECPDGGYYLVVKAKGADGKNYNIKKVINLLRGYTESSGTIE